MVIETCSNSSYCIQSYIDVVSCEKKKKKKKKDILLCSHILDKVFANHYIFTSIVWVSHIIICPLSVNIQLGCLEYFFLKYLLAQKKLIMLWSPVC